MILIIPAFAQAQAQKFNGEITICHEDITVYPWLKEDGEGLLHFQVKLIEKISNIKINLMPLPWKRCQLMAKMGKINGILSASFTKDRVTWSQYPTKTDGEVDRDYRLHTDSFLIYVNKSSNIKWINKKFENLGSTVVGVQLGYSAQEELTRMKIPVYTSFSTSVELLRAVSNNFIQAAVLQHYSTNKELKHHPEYAKHIKTMDEPFKVVDQYITFNKFFYSKNQDIADKIWKATKESRNNPEYKKRLEAYLE